MLIVGLSMPAAFGANSVIKNSMPPAVLGLHVVIVTLLSNLGKMFACLCYKKEANFKERLAVAVAMFPRGEVGAGVLAVSLSYGISGPYVTVAFMSLALNLVLTGFFIFIVKKLLVTSNITRITEGVETYVSK
jgi:Kef-type K+ transport system membrane component KefB